MNRFFTNTNYNAEIRFNKDIPQFKKIKPEEKIKIIGYEAKIKKDKDLKLTKDKKLHIKIKGSRKINHN
jgi:hypothetical protein